MSGAPRDISKTSNPKAANTQGRRHAWLGPVFVAGTVGALAIIVVASLARGRPAWWSDAPPDPALLAQAVEQGFVSQFSAIRSQTLPAPGDNPEPRPDRRTEPMIAGSPGDADPSVWSVSLLSADATAWLNERLPKWIQSTEPGVTWPSQVREVQVAFDDQAVYLGVRLGDSQASIATPAAQDRIYALRLILRVGESGELWVRTDGATVGGLPVHAATARAIARQWVRHAADELFASTEDRASQGQARIGRLVRAAGGEAPLVEQAVVRLEHGRRVRILSLTPRPGRLEIRCRTESDLAQTSNPDANPAPAAPL